MQLYHSRVTIKQTLHNFYNLYQADTSEGPEGVRLIEVSLHYQLRLLGSLSKSLRQPLLRQAEVKKPKNDAVRMLRNELLQ